MQQFLVADHIARLDEEATRTLFALLQKEFGERARQAAFEDHKEFKAARMTDDDWRSVLETNLSSDF